MRDVVKVEFQKKERVSLCKECSTMPSLYFSKRNNSVYIRCPSCGKQSNKYSPTPWEGYSQIEMARTDWNQRNKDLTGDEA